MPPTKPPYPPEFRREAVQLVRTTDKPIAQVARDLGVSGQTLKQSSPDLSLEPGAVQFQLKPAR